MIFEYSKEVEGGTYDTHGLDCGISLRQHKQQCREIDGALRVQREWTKLVSNVEGYQGGLADDFCFISVTVPECLPDRLEIMSYANEYAFLYDDAMEKLNLKNDKDDHANDFLSTFGNGALNPNSVATARPEKQLQAKLLFDMMKIDRQRAITSMTAWARFVQLAADTRKAPPKTLEEYMPSRAIDAGELFWFGTITFGMAITIPDHEYELCMELARPLYIALGLVNDLHSWEKERDAAAEEGQDYVFNAIWVIMNERGIGVDDAKDICCEETMKVMSTYWNTVKAARNNESLSDDLRRYLEALLLSYSGNLVWSIYCPRYRI
ncbi:fusicoccadiene synthase [Colletotrichum asianum]